MTRGKTLVQVKRSTNSRSGKTRGAATLPDPAPLQQPSLISPTDGDVPWLTIRGARQNNLKNVTAHLPLGRFTCVTGVSGSGKSSLVNDILYAALARDLNGAQTEPGLHDGIDGIQPLDKIIAIDQTPIGRTPRSNPATYIKLFDEIRDMFAKLPDAKLRGYKPGRFSFNVPAGGRGGGRCEACEGNGANKIEMDFLADVWVRCPICEGRRFARETMQITFKGKSIADVLQMSVAAALEHFENVPKIRSMLQTLHDVGLDYVELGQSSTTLSGGEAQRIKLARELVRKATGRTLYVLDEPTTGLHFEDIRRLLAVLHGFCDAGNTVVVIEHNLDVIKTADWIIDLGPEGGEAGGQILVAGTPEDVAACAESFTGRALRMELTGTAGEAKEASSERQVANDARRSRRANQAAHSPVATRNAQLDSITVTGARQHNLKDLTVSFPRDQMTICTGVSGSGKTSFAIDTIFTEGYRRYVESLSAYARQFLGQMAKPAVDHVEGLSPAICIEQKAASHSPRSTVGTTTEIYDYMRVLWSRVGTPHCKSCNVPIGAQTLDEIVARVMALAEGTPIILLAPVTLGDGETYNTMFNRLKASGYTRVRVDGQIIETSHAGTLDARRKHRVEVVVDRTVVKARSRGRINESVEHALALGDGTLVLLVEAVEIVPDDADSAADRGKTDAAPTSAEITADASADQSATAVASAAARLTSITAAREIRFSQRFACGRCGTSYEELSPHQYSFNSPLGWCETCEGLGVQRGAPAASIIRKPERSLLGGAIAGWSTVDKRSAFGRLLVALCDHLGVSPDAPLSAWTAAQINALLFGTDAGAGGTAAARGDHWIDGSAAFPSAAPKRGGTKSSTRKAAVSAPVSPEAGAGVRFAWRGFFPAIDAATRNSWEFRWKLRNAVTEIPCLACRGGRVRADASATRLGGKTIVEVSQLALSDTATFFADLPLSREQRQIAGELLREIRQRLQFLLDVGLEYLSLHRAAPTLSGGESQRIRLASQLGSGLSGVLYVLDEPTIGLHPRDTQRLINALLKLRNLGNTLLLVEHDRDVMKHADLLLDFGPRAGAAGGRLVAQGAPNKLLKAAGPEDESLTRGYLRGDISIPVPANRRPVPSWNDIAVEPVEEDANQRPRRAARVPAGRPAGGAAKSNEKGGGIAARLAASRRRNDPDSTDIPGWLVVRGARHNNLKNIDIPIPLARFVCVTGVSGSGKSSLVNDIIWPALSRRFYHSEATPGDHRRLDGTELLDKVINVDQSPIGATPSSNPATYTGVFDLVRELFARVPDAKMRGYNANRFSFNRPGGRCEACEGYGQKRIEMHFMPDVWVECEVCRGKRYNPETLEVRYKGKHISDVLELRVAEALELFANVPKVRRVLQTLADVGLDYVQLGQPAPTLSGGEAQRVKLATELGKPDTGRTLYILDEPTTGLHFEDVRKLLEVVHRLVDLGNSVVVVEHNLDVLKSADWIIDLGPEAGEQGGYVVVSGTPEEVVKFNFPVQSHTAAALAPILTAGPHAARTRFDPAVHAAAQLAAQKAGFGAVGKDTKMPWQLDGRKWHLEQRSSRNDKPRHWESEALLLVEKLIHDAGRGAFKPTNWNDRASVEIIADGAEEWFFHALTGGQWLCEMYFRAPRGTFDGPKLNREFGLKTLDQREDIPSYGDWPRVEVRERLGGVEAVAIYVHDVKEIDTPALRRFVKQATAAYLKWVRK